jgi:hypothetical protein
MRKKINKSAIVLTFAAAQLIAPLSPFFAADKEGDLEIKVKLPRGVAREDARLTLTINGSASMPCHIGGYGDEDGMTLFSCSPPIGKFAATLRFDLQGYRPYTVNIPNVKVDGTWKEINLGALHPKDGVGPRIENIIRTSGADGAAVFRITVNNLSKKQILVTGVSMSGSVDEECGVGNSPAIRFKISDRFSLSPSTEGVSKFVGGISEEAGATADTASIVGNGVFQNCGHNEFSLAAPLNFTLPASDFYEIQIILPKVPESNRKKIPKGRVTAISSRDAISRFDRIRFEFKTSDEEFPKLNSFYYRSSD